MTLLFDFDGTIANTLDVIVDLYNKHITKEFRCKPLDRSRIEELRNQSPATVFREFNITPLKFPFIVLRVQRLLKQYMHQVQPHVGMLELIEELHARHVPMGIITSNSSSNVKSFLLQQNWQSFFLFVRTSRSFTSKRRSIEKMITKHQLNREKLMYIGDEVRDIRSSKETKIQCAAVTWGHQSQLILEQHQPDLIIQKPCELLHYLDEYRVSYPTLAHCI